MSASYYSTTPVGITKIIPNKIDLKDIKLFGGNPLTLGQGWSTTASGYGWSPSITNTIPPKSFFVKATDYKHSKKEEPKKPNPNIKILSERPHETLQKGLEMLGLC